MMHRLSVLLILLVGTAVAQRIKTFGGGEKKSKFLGHNDEQMGIFMKEMEDMQEWWCVDQRHIGESLCHDYNKEKLSAEEVMKTMKPDPKQINAMHTEWCGRYTPEELAASGVCKMWESRKSEF